MDDFNKSPDQLADDAKQVGQDAVNKAKGVAADAKQVAQDAVATGRAYATDAVNAAGKKIDSVKSQLSQTTDYLTKAINDDPLKAVLITAVVSSLISALLVSTMRSRYY
ncbi:hypothetical protein WKW80_12005 [Variovorax humicola]|uniref:CsbD family protein n=1 Tax=Variovorax humicola TaxID=1769758 RepID=A0ABU8VY58_9BURK